MNTEKWLGHEDTKSSSVPQPIVQCGQASCKIGNVSLVASDHSIAHSAGQNCPLTRMTSHTEVSKQPITSLNPSSGHDFLPSSNKYYKATLLQLYPEDVNTSCTYTLQCNTKQDIRNGDSFQETTLTNTVNCASTLQPPGVQLTKKVSALNILDITTTSNAPKEYVSSNNTGNMSDVESYNEQTQSFNGVESTVCCLDIPGQTPTVSTSLNDSGTKGMERAERRFPWRCKRQKGMIRFTSVALFYVAAVLCVTVYTRVSDESVAQPETAKNVTPEKGKRMRRGVYILNSSTHCLTLVDQSHGLPRDFLDKEFAQKGGWLIHLAIGSYMFGAIASVCDIYFVPALEHISEDLDLQSDVAGATFMAVASSAPEFCTTVIGVFLAKNDVGVGTILGSSIFNLLVIIGVCAIFAGMPVQLTWYPLTRDTIFYTLSVTLLGFFMEDSLITWVEALTMISAYVLYFVTMFFNTKLEKWCTHLMMAHHVVNDRTTEESMESSRKRLSMLDARRHSRISKNSDNKTMLTNTGVHEVQRLGLNPQDFISKSFSRGVSLTELGMKLLEERMKAQVPNTIGTSADPKEQTKAEIVEEVPNETPHEDPKEAPREEPVEEEEEDVKFHKKDKVVVSGYENPLRFPSSFHDRCYWIIILPTTILHAYTIPDSRLLGTWRARAYLLSFTLSVIYISLYSYIMVWMVSLAGDVWEIPSTITGLTIIAAGTSVPDLLSSVFVARDGYGDMAVSNAIGSNVFDILMCLGVPWLIDAIFITKTGTPINSEGMVFTVMTLLLTIMYLWGSMKCFDWTLTPAYGIVAILVYISVIVFCVMIETNMIFDVHEHSYC
ncbi:sodium/potassium/calcium exchanger isoform X1 [Biomphalaria pfeifferi]|uniref:Sodium/potassium/calcium exchanger isoform X1 n=1 Tax=Biomphalaria pfeifferi TaxID=112525 RepID=A0AAD8FJ73_BIOPF|nr:sodium/potassium/calcium exchanger isoform X1 [Biomphalaria pfeifferi]